MHFKVKIMGVNNRILIILSTFLILFVMLSSVSAADNETYLLKENEATFSELSREIGNGGNINLTKSLYTYDSGSTIEINRSGIINGKGAVIDMGGHDIKVFDIVTDGVTLKNLTIINVCSAASAIGAQKFITIENCNFINNSASNSYGAALSLIAGGNVLGCNFKNNSALGGGAVFTLKGTIENCNFEDNYSPYYGGAVYATSAEVTGCNFTNNRAITYAGALFLALGNISYCNFSSNSADYGGGAIYLSSGNISVCEFLNNTALFGAAAYISSGNVSDCIFTNNSASNGTLFISLGKVFNCAFLNNYASYCGGGVRSVLADVQYCYFTANSARICGGAVYFDDNGRVTDSVFTNNFARDGGALFFNKKGRVVKSDFINNYAEISSLGGGAVVSKGEAIIEYSKFVNNSASYCGGALNLLDKGDVKNCDFVNNSAVGGGALYISSGSIDKCNFSNNSASYGGALAFVSSMKIENSKFMDNVANMGSAVFKLSNTNTTDSIKNCVFLNNRANSDFLEVTQNESIISVVFTGKDNYLNAIWSETDFKFKNVEYWGVDGISNTDSSTYYSSFKESGQNITVIINDSGDIEEFVKTTDINGSFSFDLGEIKGSYIISIKHDEDSYYTACESVLEFSTRIPSSTKLKPLNEYVIQAQVSPNASRNVTFVIRDIKNEIVKTESVELVNSTASIDIYELGAGKYSITAYYSGDKVYDPSNDTILHEISNLDSVILIKTSNITVGESEIITVSINNKSCNYTLWINGDIYKMRDDSLILDSLSSGIYHVTAVFDGDGVYKASANSTLFEVIKRPVPIDADDVVINVDDTAVVSATVIKELAGEIISIEVNGISKDAVVNSDGIASATFKDIPSGTFAALISYGGNENYSKNKTTARISVNKITPDVTSQNISISSGSEAILNFTASNDRNATLLVNVNNVSYAVNIVNGSATLVISDLAVGNYSVDAIYLENDKYLLKAFDGISSISVAKVMANISISASNIKAGEKEDIIIALPRDATGDITLKVNDEVLSNYSRNENVISISMPINKSGNYSVSISLTGDAKYFDSNKTASFEVSKVDDYIILADALDVILGQNSTLTLLMPYDATGNLLINNKSYSVNETIILERENSAGNKSVSIYYLGDDKYASKNAEAYYGVNKATSNIIIDVNDTYIAGEEITINLTPVNSTGSVSLSINGEDYSVINNKVIIPKGLSNATYTIIAKLEGDDNYLESMNTSVFKVNQLNSTVKIIAPDVLKFYSGPEKLSVTVSENDTAVADIWAIFIINGVSYARKTNDMGIASLAINLDSGNYSAVVEVPEYEFIDIINVFVKPTIYADDLVKVFRNDTQYYALFLDGNGNKLINTTVSFNVHGVFYNRTTDASGHARLNINLESGSYIITAVNTVTGEMKSNTITVLSQIESEDLSKYYKNDSQFVVRIIDKNGSYAGANEKVTFNINGVIYVRHTNSTGHAVLNINLDSGDYIITTCYGDCAKSNTIHVLAILTGDDLEMHYGDGFKFTANLVDATGRPYVNQVVTFNINGVFYNRTTDVNGDARLNINLQEGKYIITSSYADASISNIVTVKA